jgi:hypothetical protein
MRNNQRSFPVALLILTTALFAVAPSARAVVINTDNGGLNVTSIEDLVFMSMSFDVTFPDGSFNAVFGSGDPPASEPFFTNDASRAGSFRNAINAAFNALSTVPTSVGTLGTNIFVIPVTFDAANVTFSELGVCCVSSQWAHTASGGIERAFNIGNGNYAVITKQAVPEPTTALLLACGLAGLAARRRLH